MRALWMIFILIALTSCSRIAEPPAITTQPAQVHSWSERQASLSQIKSFGLNGKIAVQSQREAGSANLAWKTNASRYFISLSGPLGSNTMKLTGQTAGQVTLQMSDGKTYLAKSAEQLLASRWGYQLPVSNMQYWIKGLPVPGLPANTRFDGANHLVALTQQGFQITYSDYTPKGHVDLPTRINLSSPALRVKIVIYDWQIA